MESYSPNSTKKLCETEAKPPRQLYRPKGCGDPPHNELHTGYRHTVAQRFISGAVRSIRDVRPAIRKALQTLTLQRSQTTNEIGIGFCLLADEIGGILVLAGALRADHTILTEIIHTLATVDRMMIGGRQCICDVPLIPDPIAAVLRLSVNGISRDAEGLFLLYERHIVAAGSVSCGHGRHHLMRTSVAGINAMVFIDERLVSMLLCPQGTGHILRALHNASALVIQTQDGWHTVSAGRALQRRCQFLAIPNAPSRGTGSCRECGGYKGLLFHSRLRIQSTRNIM